MKNVALFLCLLAATSTYVVPVPIEQPLGVTIQVKPRMANGIIPVRALPYHAAATITEAESKRTIAVVDLDLEPGLSKSREESVRPYRIVFETKIAKNGQRAAAEVTVWKDDRIVTRQTTDVSLGR